MYSFLFCTVFGFGIRIIIFSTVFSDNWYFIPNISHYVLSLFVFQWRVLLILLIFFKESFNWFFSIFNFIEYVKQCAYITYHIAYLYWHFTLWNLEDLLTSFLHSPLFKYNCHISSTYIEYHMKWCCNFLLRP